MDAVLHDIVRDLAQQGEVQATQSLSLGSVMFTISLEDSDYSYKTVFQATLNLSSREWTWQEPDMGSLLGLLSERDRSRIREADSPGAIHDVYAKSACARLSQQYAAVESWLRLSS
jgi:hypothetical protein